MEDEKFKQIMEAIQTTKSDLKADFNDQMAKLKQDVTASRECSSQEVVKKLNKRVYQFRRKGNEAQYAFNSTVEEHMSAAKKELAKSLLVPSCKVTSRGRAGESRCEKTEDLSRRRY